ncbi:MAG TPA: hypothetical protein ENF49_05105 [Candidatus Altiarchaeales archaeon]|nr:hypothetical protein [Candidatus Altiarchaeales archaeon]HEX55487.1 hypothetical protein [Candidatus Altiarchaeales archaeon]
MKKLNHYQREVDEYDRKYGWDVDRASHIVLHMAEELGEIARLILRNEGYKTEKFEKKELAYELTDLLYLTLKLANKFEINLEKEWDEMWKRYEKKTSRL